MKTTFKAILASELLAVCSETTERQRKKPEKKDNSKFSAEERSDIYSAMSGWDAGFKDRMMKTFSILLKAPELATDKNGILFDLFSVAVCEARENGHPWKKKPFIIVHSKNQCGLGPTGEMETYFRDNDRPRLATAEEIVTCIENLTEAQWNKVRTDALFSPIVEASMNREVVIDENEVILTEADRQAADETP